MCRYLPSYSIRLTSIYRSNLPFFEVSLLEQLSKHLLVLLVTHVVSVVVHVNVVMGVGKPDNNPNEIHLKVVIAYNLVNTAMHLVGSYYVFV